MKSPRQVEERPTTMQHAGMLAIYNNPNSEKSEIVAYLQARGWITSKTTLYGTKTRPAILTTLINLNLTMMDNDKYKLTEEGRKWIMPSMIIEKAQGLGADLHRRLIIKAIETLHETNQLVIAPEGKDMPDLMAYPMAKESKKYLWDDKNRRAYEIQTTARKENIMANRERNIKLGLPTAWITYTNEPMEEIKKLTENKDEYLLISM
jgi:hypothetical protein